MSIRLGVDLDGTLADLSSLYLRVRDEWAQVEDVDDDESGRRLSEAGASDKERLRAARRRVKLREAVWKELQATRDLWTQLAPIEEGAVKRLYDVSVRLNWEVFFITQRPRSEGASVQRQTQQWLVDQGFECPSVLTLRGPRGKAAHALDLDFLLDDLSQNCVDVIADSTCRPLLVLRKPDEATEVAARQMQISVVRSVHEAVDLLSQPAPASRPTMVDHILKLLRVM